MDPGSMCMGADLGRRCAQCMRILDLGMWTLVMCMRLWLLGSKQPNPHAQIHDPHTQVRMHVATWIMDLLRVDLGAWIVDLGMWTWVPCVCLTVELGFRVMDLVMDLDMCVCICGCGCLGWVGCGCGSGCGCVGLGVQGLGWFVGCPGFFVGCRVDPRAGLTAWGRASSRFKP